MQAQLSGIWDCRYFWLSLVAVDLRQRYRRSFLGIGWSLLHPIAFTAVICVVFHRVFKMDIRDYIPFLVVGLTFWNFVTTSVLSGCDAFLLGESYIRHHPAPMSIYTLRTTLGALVHYGFALIVAFSVVSFFKRIPPPLALLSLLPTLTLVFAVAWATATVMAVANVCFPDTKHLTEVAMQVLFYATPIIYPTSPLENTRIGLFVRWNPLGLFVEMIRAPLVNGTAPTPLQFGVAAGFAATIGLVAIFLMARMEKRIVFYL